MMEDSQQDEALDPLTAGGFSRSWRQGSVLIESDALSLGLITQSANTQFVIVATHDCDCVADERDEPKLELIIGQQIPGEEYDGNLTLAKSTRKLHLEIGEGTYVELSSITRTSVTKRSLVGKLPSITWSLGNDQRRVFRRWLAARYERASFPDELVRRLRPAANHFKKVSKNDGSTIIGFYVQFDPDRELEADSLEPYAFRITVVYDSSKDGAVDAAKRISASLHDKFVKEFKVLETVSGLHWSNIELESCVVRSDIEFTLQEALSSYVYRLDDASLKSGEDAQVPPQ